MANPFEDYASISENGLMPHNAVITPKEKQTQMQHATHPMISLLLTGKCQVWLSEDSDAYWLGGDDPGYMIFADVLGAGHYVSYPSV